MSPSRRRYSRDFKLEVIRRIRDSGLKSRNRFALENIALRHQLDGLRRNAELMRLKPSDQALWAVISRGFSLIGGAI